MICSSWPFMGSSPVRVAGGVRKDSRPASVLRQLAQGNESINIRQSIVLLLQNAIPILTVEFLKPSSLTVGPNSKYEGQIVCYMASLPLSSHRGICDYCDSLSISD